jgi:hypothetical protein
MAFERGCGALARWRLLRAALARPAIVLGASRGLAVHILLGNRLGGSLRSLRGRPAPDSIPIPCEKEIVR